MDFTTLRYFVEIAREENMTRAANRLHISQSALSKRLASLEERLDTKLFRRRSFSIELTDEGRRLHERAQELLQLHDKIESEFRDLHEPLGGTLAFGMAESRSVCLVARAVRQLKESAPKLLCRIESGDTALMTMLLEKGILDFGLVVEEPDPRKFHAIELPAKDRWVLILPNLVSAFNVIIIRNFFQGLPPGYAEAARMDGAREWTILFRIYMPLSKPALATVALWTAVFHWNSWFDAMIYITDDRKQVLQNIVQRIVIDGSTELLDSGTLDSSISNPEGLKAACVILTVLPMICLYPFVQKYFVKGINLGGIKE